MRVNTYRVCLVKEQGINYQPEVTTPLQAGDLLEKLFNASTRCEEHSWMIALDCKGKIAGVFELATGTQTTCIMDPAGVARNALLTNAYGVILAHNHPSGNPQPSNEDVQITKQISAGLKLLNIQLLDHIIIGNVPLSMRENGYF